MTKIYAFTKNSWRTISPQFISLIFTCMLIWPAPGCSQKSSDWKLDKMPAELESELALSALPDHLRSGATVYLLDPAKGYYISHQGTNGFICFISRTEWEWGEFRNDLAAPMAYDAEGAKTIFPVYQDVAAMRASGKFTALQIKDSVINRLNKGLYKAPARTGVSYMLAPIMRVYTGKPGDRTVMTVSMPHYMFYAPFITPSDVGLEYNSPQAPFLVNPGNTVLGEGKGPYGFIIMPATAEVTTKIENDGKDLLKRLSDYSAIFKLGDGTMHH